MQVSYFIRCHLKHQLVLIFPRIYTLRFRVFLIIRRFNFNIGR
eukprot:UN04831